MSVEKLDANLQKFWSDLTKGLEKLTKPEKQIFMDGLFLGLNSYFALARPDVLTLFEKERFMSSVQSQVYSAVHGLDLDSSSMELQMKSSHPGWAAHYRYASVIQELMGEPLTMEEQIDFENVVEHPYAVESETPPT